MNKFYSVSEKEVINLTDRTVDYHEIPETSDNEEEPEMKEFDYFDQFPHMDPDFKNLLRIFKEAAEEKARIELAEFRELNREKWEKERQQKEAAKTGLITNLSKGENEAKKELEKSAMTQDNSNQNDKTGRENEDKKSQKKSQKKSDNTAKKTPNTQGTSTILRQGTKQIWKNCQIIPDQFIMADLFMRALVYETMTVFQDSSSTKMLAEFFDAIERRISRGSLNQKEFQQEFSLFKWISNDVYQEKFFNYDLYKSYKEKCDFLKDLLKDKKSSDFFLNLKKVFNDLKSQEEYNLNFFLTYSSATAYAKEYMEDETIKQMVEEKDINIVVADLIFTINYGEGGVVKSAYIHIPVYNEKRSVINIDFNGGEELIKAEIAEIRMFFSQMVEEKKTQITPKEQSLIDHFVRSNELLLKHSEKTLYAELYLNAENYKNLLLKRCEKFPNYKVEGMAVHLYSTREPCHHCHIFLAHPWNNLLKQYQKHLGDNCGTLFTSIEKYTSFSIVYDDPDHITNSNTEITQDKNFYLYNNLITWFSPTFFDGLINSFMQERRVMRSFFISYKPKSGKNYPELTDKCEIICRKYFFDETDMVFFGSDKELKKTLKQSILGAFNFAKIVESYDEEVEKLFYIREKVNKEMELFAEAFVKATGIQIFLQVDHNDLKAFIEKLMKEERYLNEPVIFCINTENGEVCSRFYNQLTPLDIVTVMITLEEGLPRVFFNCFNRKCKGLDCGKILAGLPFKENLTFSPAFGLCNKCKEVGSHKNLRKIESYATMRKFDAANLFYLDSLVMRLANPNICNQCGLSKVLRKVDDYQIRIINKTPIQDFICEVKKAFTSMNDNRFQEEESNYYEDDK